jgi:hypothetical protein
MFLKPYVRWPIAIVSGAGVLFFTGLMFLLMMEDRSSRMAYPGQAFACGIAVLVLGAIAVFMIQGRWAGPVRRWALILGSVVLAQVALICLLEAGDAKGTGWYALAALALGGLAVAAFRWGLRG